MNKFILTCSWLLTSIFLSSCASSPATYESENAQACNTGAVRLTAAFEASRMDECKKLDNNKFLILLKPENTPINDSPWYAFKVTSKTEQTVKVTIKVSGKRHNRYLPKISHDLKSWQIHPHEYKNKRLTLAVAASSTPTYIAAQEVIDNQYYVDWAKKLQATQSLSHNVLGKTVQGRPIYKLESRSKAGSKEWLVILGRLHPPEITGALALFPFAETLLSNNKLADNFREKYNLLIIPNLNPDGVAMGNWRHNANGVDLNRDWISFNQPETTQVHQYLQQLVAQGQKIKFAVDFHSTQHDVFYTMPVDYGVEDAYFVKHWLGALDKAMPNFEVVQKPGNKPNNGVSKQYFADNFNVHAITYEMGDETNRDNIKVIAKNAATLLMTTMLSATNHNKE
jgi:hypothetical protein